MNVNFRSLLLLLICVLSIGNLLFATTSFVSIEKSIDKGRYNTALRKAKRAYKSALKSKDLTKQFDALMCKAMAEEALCKYEKWDSTLYQAQKVSNSISKDSVRWHIHAMRLRSKFWRGQGNIHKAKCYLDTAIYLSNLVYNDSTQYADLLVLLDDINLDLGYNRQVEQHIQNIGSFFKSIEHALQDKKTRKDFTKKQKTNWYSILATYKNIQIQIALQVGNFNAVDSLYNQDYPWVKKKLGKSHDQAQEMLMHVAQKYEILGNESKATQTYLKAFKRSSNRFSQKKMLGLLEKVILSYAIENDKHRSRKYTRKLESALAFSYGRRNPQYTRYGLIDVKTAILYSKFDKAEKRLNKLFQSKVAVPRNTPLYAEMLELSTFLATKNSDYERALDSLKVRLEIQKNLLGNTSPAYHHQELKLGLFYTEYTSRFTQAQQIQTNSFDKVVKSQLSALHPNYIKYVQNQATIYDLLDAYDKALQVLQSLAQEVEKYYGKQSIVYTTLLQRQAELFLKKGDYPKAETSVNQAVEIMKKIATTADAATKAATYSTLAKLYTTLGQYQLAQDALSKAKKNVKKAKSDESVSSKSSDELADFYLKNGRFNDAENLLEQTLYIRERRFGPQSKEVWTSLNQLAMLNLMKGDYTIADRLIQRSISISSKIFGDSSIRFTESLLLYQGQLKGVGELTRAEANAESIIKITEKQLGTDHVSLSSAYAEKALIKQKTDPKNTESEYLLIKGVDIQRKAAGVNSPGYATAITQLAKFYLEQKKYEKSDSLLQSAQLVWTQLQGSNNINSAEIAYLEGLSLYYQGKYISAKYRFQQARNLYKIFFNKKHPMYVKSTSKLAHAYFMDKEYSKALSLMDEIIATELAFTKYFFPSMSFNEKSKYWNQIKDDFEFYAILALTLKEKRPELLIKVYNQTIATKAILLSASIKMKERILNSKDDQLINKYNQWINKKEQMATYVSLSNESLKNLNISLTTLEKEINLLEKDLSESSELFATNAERRAISWSDIKKALKINQAAIEIIRLRHFNGTFTDSILYAAFVTKPGKSKYPELVILPNGKQLEGKYLKNYRNATKLQTDENLSYEMYWKPLKQIIPNGYDVYLSGDGVYNQINIEAMQSQDGGYPIDYNQFIWVTNTKDIYLHTKKEPNQKVTKAVLCGNPIFYAQTSKQGDSDGDRAINIEPKKIVRKSEVQAKTTQRDFRSNTEIVQLPGTEEEIKNIAQYLQHKQWKVKKIVGLQADEDTIKRIFNPRVFHIATHGFFKEDLKKDELSGLTVSEAEFTQNPLLRSGLLLKGAGDVLKSNSLLDINSENGVLTAYEAMNMNLDATELVILSACETGLGEVQIGEGVFGLQRAFLVAGANTLIMSLFKVNDEVTQKLMTRFYELWLQSNDKKQAFNQAKKEIKQLYPQPIYWGSFVMTGL